MPPGGWSVHRHPDIVDLSATLPWAVSSDLSGARKPKPTAAVDIAEGWSVIALWEDLAPGRR